ncbi:WXG100 family type VII secretion target, partial [Micromonospora sp. DT201]
SDGSVFTEFYENGDPKSGKTAEGVSVGIVYNSDGGSEITYGSGVVVRVNGNGDPVWMKTSDGSVFTEFYENGDPKSGKTAEGVSVGIVYNSDGGSEITYGSGVVVRVNEKGDPYWMKTSDGSIFTEFDEKGRPEKGKTSTGEDIDITYNTGDDGYKVVVGDKVTVYGPDGAPIKLTVGDDLIFDKFEAGFFRRGYDAKTNRFFGIEYLPNGDVRWVFGKDDWIEFDPNGTPTEGFRPGPDGGHFSFAVEIDKLASAADFTGLRRRDIATELGDLQSALKSVEAHWRSPAGGSFQAYAAVLKTAGDNLLTMLDESERRLRATYHNYVNAESQNAGNFTPK